MRIISLIKSHKLESFLLAIILVTAISFRFYKIRDYIVFLGDEGRDMMVMKKMIDTKRPIFLGPTASVGGFYLGPIYYWMAAPFLLLSRFDPVGPAYMVAILGVGTVLLLYKFLREISIPAAVIASLLYSVAPLIVRYSRSSWNPNPLPFFALLMMYFLYLGATRKKSLYFLFAGACFGVAIQLHYLAAILIAVAGFIILVTNSPKRWPFIGINSILGTIITFSPFLLFEFKNNFPNFITIREFVTRGTTVGFRNPNVVWLLSNIGNIFLEEITKIKGTIITIIAFWTITIGGFTGLILNWKDHKKRVLFTIAIVWFLGSLAGLRFYSGQIFDYYFGLMFPAPFLLLGGVISVVWRYKISRPIIVGLTCVAVVLFVQNGFHKSSPNRLLQQTSYVADVVIQKSQNKPYNFAMISDHNSDHAYRYYLEIKKHKPVELEEMITDQLLVVCESKNCSPLGNPIWEIAGFGRAEVVEESELPDIGIKVVRLIHWPGAPNPAGKPAIKDK